MALHEINANLLKKNNENLIYRFLQDTSSSITLHIWQKKDEMGAAPQFGMEKFQISHADKIIEWNGKELTYGSVDSGESRIGMKQSPMMMMGREVDREELSFCRQYLNDRENREIPGISFICRVLERRFEN